MLQVMREIRRRARWVFPQLLGLGLVVYFCFHLVQGDRGIFAYLQLTAELDAAEAVAATLDAELAKESERVARLSSGSLDRDMLEERAHALIGYVRADEYVIFLD